LNLNSFYDGITLPYTGAYTATIIPSGTTTGPYSFELFDVSTGSTPLTLNTTLSDTLTGGRTAKLYSFTATAGQQFYLQGLSDQISGGAGTALLGPDNNRVGGIGTYTEDNSGPVTLTESGTYILEVAAQSFTNVSNNFSVAPWLSTTPTTALTFNTLISGSLAVPGAEHVYTFTGYPGQRLIFDGQTPNSNFGAFLTGPNGAQIWNVNTTSDYAATPALSLPGQYNADDLRRRFCDGFLRLPDS